MILSGCSNNDSSLSKIPFVLFQKADDGQSQQVVKSATLYANNETKKYPDLKNTSLMSQKFNSFKNSVVLVEFNGNISEYDNMGNAKMHPAFKDIKKTYNVDDVYFSNDEIYLVITYFPSNNYGKRMIRRLTNNYEKINDVQLDDMASVIKVIDGKIYYLLDNDEGKSKLIQRDFNTDKETVLYEYDIDDNISDFIVNDNNIFVLTEDLDNNKVELSKVEKKKITTKEEISKDQALIFDSTKLSDGTQVLTYGTYKYEDDLEQDQGVFDNVELDIGYIKITKDGQMSNKKGICNVIVPSLTSDKLYCTNLEKITQVDLASDKETEFDLPKDLKLTKDNLNEYNLGFFDPQTK